MYISVDVLVLAYLDLIHLLLISPQSIDVNSLNRRYMSTYASNRYTPLIHTSASLVSLAVLDLSLCREMGGGNDGPDGGRNPPTASSSRSSSDTSQGGGGGGGGGVSAAAAGGVDVGIAARAVLVGALAAGSKSAAIVKVLEQRM